MGLVRKRAWPGVYPWIAGEHVAPLFYSGYQAPPVPMGLGAVPANPCDTRWAWAIPKCWWSPSDAIAPPRAPEGSVLTVPPADEASAQATVDALLNQQLADQQARDAAEVTPSFIGEVYGTATNPIGGMSPLAWLGLGLGAFALVAFAGGGSPRRYGR